MYKEQKVCRVCSGTLTSVLNVGEIYPSNFVAESDGEKAPLRLGICDSCKLVQLMHTVDLDSMYRKYWYKSGLNPTMVRDLTDVADSIKDLGYVEGRVLDIGANDGTLLDILGENFYRVGVDPARNIADETVMDEFINDYFPSDKIEGKFDVITSIAMFYDLPDPNTFIEGINKHLADEGVWVVQFTDLISMLKLNAVDNLCHEHLEIYSLEYLIDLFRVHNLSVFMVEYNEVNGGSIRLYVDKHNRPTHNSINYYLYKERTYFAELGGVQSALACFATRVTHARASLLTYFEETNERVFVLGASTKGNSLLQYYGLDNSVIEYALEVNEDKFGLKTVGTHIPIIAESEGLELRPDSLLILPWHFKAFFVAKLFSYLLEGGKLIVPLPEPAVGYMGKFGNIVWENL